MLIFLSISKKCYECSNVNGHFIRTLRERINFVKMNTNLVNEVSKTQLRTDFPAFKAGDTVKVNVRIVEGGKTRIQAFEGVVIERRGHGVSETFMVRKMSDKIGVERIFPVHSPNVVSVEVLKIGRVRRSKIFYLRNRSGKAARIKEVLKK